LEALKYQFTFLLAFNATNERSDWLIVENNLASCATLNASVVVGVRKNETGVDAVVAVFFVSFVM